MNSSIVTPPSFLTYSLGCRTNQAEIESLSRQLQDRGFAVCRPSSLPQIVLLNTCVVTQKAQRETRKEIRKLRRAYPKAFLVVLGCAVTAQEKLGFNLPQADWLISNEEKQRVADLLEEKYKTVLTKKGKIEKKSKYALSGRKFIKIQEGCDRFCTFCLTACLRGHPTSLPVDKIIKEINFWLENSIREIILTGTNISLYGQDLKPKTALTDLTRKILEKTPTPRLSLSSIYPQSLTPDFLKLVLGNPRVSQYFHLSIQSGSSSVLKKMNRSTDISKNSLMQIKQKVPEFTFRADLIVGFPGETKKEFEETLQLIKVAPISFVHVFPFSKRPGTVAFEMIRRKKWQEVSSQIKKERVKKVLEIAKEVRQKEGRKQINKTTSCLIIRDKEGLTQNGWPITIGTMSNEQGTMGLKGKILPVKITDFKNDQLFGEIISLPR